MMSIVPSSERVRVSAQKFRLRARTSTSCGLFLCHRTHLYWMCLLSCQPGNSATIAHTAAVCSPCTSFLCRLSSWAWPLAAGIGGTALPLELSCQKELASIICPSTCLRHQVRVCSCAWTSLACRCWRELSKCYLDHLALTSLPSPHQISLPQKSGSGFAKAFNFWLFFFLSPISFENIVPPLPLPMSSSFSSQFNILGLYHNWDIC